MQFPVTLVTSGGTTNFANNHQIILATIANTVSISWLAGGSYSNPAITFAASSNTLIASQSITTSTSTAKILILGTFEATATAPALIFMTIGRSTSSPTAANTINLTDRVSALTNSLSGNGLAMWRASSSSSQFTAYASVVDTPGTPGTYYYSLWGRDNATIVDVTTELVNLTILQVTS